MNARRLAKAFIMLWLACPLFFLSAVSMAPPVAKEPQPYDSAVLLGEWDFSKPLSPSETGVADNILVQVTTLGKGDPLYVWFGHAALVITDIKNNRSVMYDYGVFSFDDDFYRTFAMGRMFYQVWATSAKARFAQAKDEDRDMHLLTLDLPPEAKLTLVRFLNFNILPENQTYLYHHYRDNCATRVRDIIDKAVDGQFKTWATSVAANQTYRQHVSRHTSQNPLIEWALDFLQSGRIDHPITLWEEMFLPQKLEEALMGFTYIDNVGQSRPLVNNLEVVNRESETSGRAPVSETYHSMAPIAIGFGLAIGLLSLLLTRGFLSSSFTSIRTISHFLWGLVNGLWTLIVGLLASLLLFMMVFTSHDVTYGNENILLATPWLLVMSFWCFQVQFGSKKALRRFRKSCSVSSIAIMLLILLKIVFPDLLIQQNWPIIGTLLPLYLLNSNLSFHRLKAYFIRVEAAQARQKKAASPQRDATLV
ncbi:MAG: DUF4105 domain-containing protein [Sphaerochaetaceae bacterium]